LPPYPTPSPGCYKPHRVPIRPLHEYLPTPPRFPPCLLLSPTAVVAHVHAPLRGQRSPSRASAPTTDAQLFYACRSVHLTGANPSPQLSQSYPQAQGYSKRIAIRSIDRNRITYGSYNHMPISFFIYGLFFIVYGTRLRITIGYRYHLL
jgi:hypothetical protein